MFGVCTIEILDGEWFLVRNTEPVLSLAESHHVACFVPRQGMWREVQIGRVREWDGELSYVWDSADAWPTTERYSGKAVAMAGHEYAYCPAPHLEVGVWAAYERTTRACWALNPHDIVKTTDVDNIGNVPLQPFGCFVYSADRYPPESLLARPLGLVAFDLRALPFDPAEYEVRDGAYLSTDRLTLNIELDETEKLFGELDVGRIYYGIFWSD